MKYFVLYCLVLNVISAFYDKIIIDRSNNPYRKSGIIPHSLGSLYDFVLYTGLVLMMYFNVLIIQNWYYIPFVLFYPVMFRWIIRDLILGVGTTSFIDKILNNRLTRISFQILLCAILTIIQINIKL